MVPNDCNETSDEQNSSQTLDDDDDDDNYSQLTDSQALEFNQVEIEINSSATVEPAKLKSALSMTLDSVVRN
jgi:hypothetical protein